MVTTDDLVMESARIPQLQDSMLLSRVAAAWHASNCIGAPLQAQRILLVMRDSSAAISNFSLSNFPSYSSAQSAKQFASFPCTQVASSQTLL